MYTISSFSLAKLNNAEFVGYCVNLANLIERAEATKLGLETQLVTDFTALKAKLIDQVYAQQGSQFTVAMKAADEKRDKIYKRIMLKIQIICEAETGSQLLQFKDKLETVILTKYGYAVMSMAQQAESAVLQGFVHDMTTFFSEDDLDDMDLTSDLTNLESANQEFISAYASRSDERAASDTGLTVKLRTQMQDFIAQIYFTVQYLANSTLEANATKAADCQTFIGALNVILADAKKRWNQRLNGEEGSDAAGGGANAGGGNDAGGNTPASGGNDTPSGGNTPAGGNDTPSGGNTPSSGNDTPSGGNTPTGGNDTPASGNDSDVDRENGTLNGGTVEF